MKKFLIASCFRGDEVLQSKKTKMEVTAYEKKKLELVDCTYFGDGFNRMQSAKHSTNDRRFGGHRDFIYQRCALRH